MEQKSVSRDALVQESRDALSELVHEMHRGVADHPGIEEKLVALSMELQNVGGKHQYGYLKKPFKKKVDAIVDELEELPMVSECYDRWLELQSQVDSFYRDEKRKRIRLSEQKEFRAIKNMVIREAENLRLTLQTDEDAERRGAQTAANNAREQYAAISVVRLLHHLSLIFRETPPPTNPAGPRADSKRRRKLLKKRLALGHRIDDHEDALNDKYQYPTHTM